MATTRATKPSLRKTAWGYVRYSTASQGENSVERQVEAIERWASRFGVTIVAISYDFEVSRTTDHEARPGLSLALDEVKAKHIGALVAENVSRYAGSPAILDGLRAALKRVKARLATADESGNADLDEDRQDFDALLSKREIKQIRARTKGALAVKRLRGEACSHAPWGFRRKPDGAHVVRRGIRVCGADCAGCLRLEPDEREAAVITRAKALSDEDKSIRRIQEALASEGVVGRTGNPLSHTQIHRFLRPLLMALAGVAA